MHIVKELLVPLVIVTFMFRVGVATPPGTFRSVRLGVVLRWLVVMLLFGPLLAFAVARLTHPPEAVAVALVLLACVGVLPLSPRRAHAAHGSSGTGVVLALALAFITIFTAGPTGRVLLSYSGQVVIHPLPLLVRVLVLQGLSLVIGILVGRISRYAATIEAIVAKVNLVLLITLHLIVLGPLLRTLTAIGWRGAVATTLFAMVLGGLGYLAGGSRVEDRRATGALANMPNVGFALTIVSSAAPVMATTVLAVFLVRVLVGVVIVRAAAGARAHAPSGARV